MFWDIETGCAFLQVASPMILLRVFKRGALATAVGVMKPHMADNIEVHPNFRDVSNCFIHTKLPWNNHQILQIFQC